MTHPKCSVVSGCGRESNLMMVRCLVLLLLAGAASSIRFYETCEVGRCDNGGTMLFPQTFFGMCRCICPYPYTGALCRNRLKHVPTPKSQQLLSNILRRRRR